MGDTRSLDYSSHKSVEGWNHGTLLWAFSLFGCLLSAPGLMVSLYNSNNGTTNNTNRSNSSNNGNSSSGNNNTNRQNRCRHLCSEGRQGKGPMSGAHTFNLRAWIMRRDDTRSMSSASSRSWGLFLGKS